MKLPDGVGGGHCLLMMLRKANNISKEQNQP